MTARVGVLAHTNTQRLSPSIVASQKLLTGVQKFAVIICEESAHAVSHVLFYILTTLYLHAETISRAYVRVEMRAHITT